MAYMNQEKKAKIAALLKPVLKKYGVKGSLSVRSRMTICLTVTSGSIDFFSEFSESHAVRQHGHVDVNRHWYHNQFVGKAKEFFDEAFAALYGADYYDNSDAMTDYFDTAYYVDLSIGKWNKPYTVTN